MALLLWCCVAALLLAYPGTSEAQMVVATLSADATPVPGGYAVPVGGNITFTCIHNGSSGPALFWELAIANGTVTMTPTSAVFLRDEPGLSTSVSSNTDNPVNVTVHNLQLANNGSTVTCQLEKEGSPVVILVEGVPSCAVLKTQQMGSTLTATLSAAGRPWFLPVLFIVTVTVTASYSQTSTNSTEMNNIFNITSIQDMTAYNISVVPCNSFGCNEDCPHEYIPVQPTEDTSNTNPAGYNPSSGVGMISFPAIIGAASTGILVIVIALTAAVVAVWVIKWRRERRNVNITERTLPEEKPPFNSASQYASVEDCVCSLNTLTPDSKSKVPGIAIDTIGYGEVLHSAPKLQRVRSSNHTSKSVDDRSSPNQAANLATYATVLDAMPNKSLPDTAAPEESPPPIPPRNLEVAQDLGYAFVLCNQESDEALQVHNLCSNSVDSLPIEEAAEGEQ